MFEDRITLSELVDALDEAVNQLEEMGYSYVDYSKFNVRVKRVRKRCVVEIIFPTFAV